MVKMNPVDSLYLDEEVSVYTKKLVDDGIFDRQVDFLFLGFSYAVINKLRPKERIERHDLLRAGALDDGIRSGIEAVAPSFAKEIDAPSPEDPKALLDFVCRVGSAGIAALQEAWKNKSRNQIRHALFDLVPQIDDSTN